MALEHDLAIADEHVAHGERVVARQRTIIAELGAQGQDTTDAEDTLAMFEQSLEEYRRHRETIVAEVEGAIRIAPTSLPSRTWAQQRA
jgi:hypothetical protein